MKNLKSILVYTILGLSTSQAAPYIQEDTLELKTTYPDGRPRTIYKGTRFGKIANLELYDSLGAESLKLTEYFQTLGEFCYFKDSSYTNQLDDELIEREVGILLDSLKALKIRVDKISKASGTLLLWINREGFVEHAVWYWYSGITRLFMRKSMNYAETWKIKPMSPRKGIVVRRNVDFN